MWRSQNFPSLESAKVIFRHVPLAFMQPCLLPPDVRDVYLDPAFFPPARNASVGPRPLSCRVRTPQDQADCFLAQYHAQHLLPRDLLEAKGILCSILNDNGFMRFFSAAEVASAHAANLVHFMPDNDRDAMRMLGNSLAVPQAAFVAALAVQVFAPIIQPPDPQEVVSRVLSDRMDSLNAVVLKVEGGWLLCHRLHLATVLGRSALRQQAILAQRQVEVKTRECIIKCPDGTPHTVQLLGTIREEQVPELLPAALTHQLVAAPSPAVFVVDEVTRCPLSFGGHDARQTSTTEIISLLSPCHTFVVNVRHADVFVNLSAAFRTMQGSTNDVVVCSTIYGDQLHSLQRLPSVAVLHTVPDIVFFPHFCLNMLEVAAATCVSQGSFMVFALPATVADAWWLCFPASTLRAFGVQCLWEHYPVVPGEHAVLTLQTSLDFYSLPEDELQLWMRTQLFLAMLRHDEGSARRSDRPVHEVEVELVASTVWQGVLPQDFSFHDLEQRWTLASEFMHLPSRARFFSGAYEHLPTMRLDTVRNDPPYLHRRRGTGAILLNVHPEVRGGGTKDEALRAIKAELVISVWEKAAVCLRSRVRWGSWFPRPACPSFRLCCGCLAKKRSGVACRRLCMHRVSVPQLQMRRLTKLLVAFKPPPGAANCSSSLSWPVTLHSLRAFLWVRMARPCLFSLRLSQAPRK